MRHALFVAILTVSGVLLFPAPAVADGLHICDKAGEPLHVAVATFYRGSTTELPWIESEGWWNLSPGACVTPIAEALKPEADYYYYAFSNTGAWSGSEQFCVDPEHRFTYDGYDAYPVSDQTGTPPRCRRGAQRGFRKADTSGSTDDTVNLTP